MADQTSTITVSSEESSHIGDLLEKDSDRESSTPAEENTTHVQEGKNEAMEEGQAAVTLTREQFNHGIRIHNAEVRAAGHPSQAIEPIWGTAQVIDEYGNRCSNAVHTISSDDSSELSSPPTTSYSGSEISFPSKTPQERVMSPLPTTNYSEGSLLGLPPSAVDQDPFATPRASGKSILAKRYIQSEENISMHAAMDEEEKEGGVPDTLRRSGTPTFESSDEDDAMTVVVWRDEEIYLTPTKKGKKRYKGKGVKRPVTPERPIPNMPQTPSRRTLEADWAQPADEVTNEKKEVNLEAFIGEYLKNTNGLRDFMINKAKYDNSYSEWCGEQVNHIAARQNHTDAAIRSTREIAKEVKEQVELSRDYDEARAEKLDERLSKIEKRMGKIAPVNMANTIENAMKSCMEGMIDQLTDRVVKRFEDAAEKDRKKTEIRRGKQVEATPENKGISDIEFEPGATFSEEENEKVAKVIERMEVEEQQLEASKHAPVIPPGEKRQEFPRYTPSGQVTIAKRPVIAPAVPEQKKKEVKKPEVKEIPKGPKAGVGGRLWSC